MRGHGGWDLRKCRLAQVRACEVTEVWTGRGRFTNRPYGLGCADLIHDVGRRASPGACREQEAFGGPYGLMAFMMSAMAWAAKRSPSMTMVNDAAPTIHLRSEGRMPWTLISCMLSSTLALASAYGSVSG